VETAVLGRAILGACATSTFALLAACGHPSSHVGGISKPLTLGSGDTALVASPLGGVNTSITSGAANSVIDSAMATGSWPGARRIKFGLARVTTNATDLGGLVRRPAWIAVYSVPAMDVPPGAGTGSQSAECHWRTNARVDIVVVVDAQSGDSGVWNQVGCP